MASLLQNHPLELLIAFIAGSAVGVGTYSFCRWLERNMPLTFYTLEYFAGFLALVASLMGLFFWFVFTSVLAPLGGWLHRRSGGGSPNGTVAFFAASFSTSLSVMLGLLILMKVGWSRGSMLPSLPEVVFLLATTFFPTLAPLAFWIWNSSQVRPGIDEALEDIPTP